MKSLPLIIAIGLLAAGCGGPKVYYDEFSGVTTETSGWVDATRKSPISYLELAAICETAPGREAEYCLDVKVGNAIAEGTLTVTYPEIAEGESLHLLADGEPLVFSTEETGLDKRPQAGLFMGWAVERARYRQVSEEDLQKIAAANEVKIKVDCKSQGARTGVISRNSRKQIIAFVDAHVGRDVAMVDPGE